MGGCATKPTTVDGPGPGPEASPGEGSVALEPTVATKTKAEGAQSENVEKENYKEERLVDLSTPKSDATDAAELKLPSNLGELKQEVVPSPPIYGEVNKEVAPSPPTDGEVKKAVLVEAAKQRDADKAEEVVEAEVTPMLI